MFSIVIPLYNKAQTIERTLRTVLSQTFSAFEVVIVNDGSTDNGVEIIKNAFNDPRIKIVEQQNQGVSVARNKGVSASQYDFVSFLDGDDEWMPDYLRYVREMIRQYPDAGMYCTAGIVRSNGYDHLRLVERYKGKILQVDYLKYPFAFSHTSATTIAKSYFNKTKGFPPGVRNFQDFYLFTSIALLSPVIYCGIPLSIYIGDVQGQATATVSFSSKLEFRVRYLNEFTTLYLENHNSKLIRWLRAFARNEIWFMLRASKFDNIRLYISMMDATTRRLCLGIGGSLYPEKKWRIISLFYIAVYKSLFKLKGYPQINMNKGKVKTIA